MAGASCVCDQGHWRAPMKRSLSWTGLLPTPELSVETLRSASSAVSSIVTNALCTEPGWSGDCTPKQESHQGLRAGQWAGSPVSRQPLFELRPRHSFRQRPTAVAPHPGHAPGPRHPVPLRVNAVANATEAGRGIGVGPARNSIAGSCEALRARKRSPRQPVWPGPLLTIVLQPLRPSQGCVVRQCCPRACGGIRDQVFEQASDHRVRGRSVGPVQHGQTAQASTAWSPRRARPWTQA